jgi:hypothetical protein
VLIHSLGFHSCCGLPHLNDMLLKVLRLISSLGGIRNNSYPLELAPKLKEFHFMQCSPRSPSVFYEAICKKHGSK